MKGIAVNSSKEYQPRLIDVVKARGRIYGHVAHPPMQKSAWLSKQFGRDVWLKPECIQLTGSFKFRGALNRLTLHRGRSGSPVVTVSTGNQALGLAAAGRIVGIDTVVVVPETVSSAKLAALRDLGAVVELRGENFDEAEHAMFELAKEFELEIVSSVDPEVIAGHGTVVWEMFDEVPGLSAILVPVASGGLIAGSVVVARDVSPDCVVIGVQAANAPAMHAALRARALKPVDELPTIADGLAGNVLESRLPFEIILQSVPEIALVREESMLRAIRELLQQDHLIVEAAGAASVAALLEDQLPPGDGPIGAILTGGNIPSTLLQRALTV